MKKTYLIYIIIFTACIRDIQAPELTTGVTELVFDYDQLNKTLYLKVGVEPGSEMIDSVEVVIFNSEIGLDSTFVLNDEGLSGDLIARNNTYSLQVPIELAFLSYTVYTKIYYYGNVLQEVHEYTIEEQFPPEVLSIMFIKSYADGRKYEFDSSSPYYVNDEDTSFLNFQITIKDLNGIGSIKSIRYKTETFWFSAVGEECGCEEEKTCNITSPVFYLNNINLMPNDSIFTFEAINNYIEKPGFPINPTSVCNRFGTITFSFIVFDAFWGPQTFPPISLLFSPCSEGQWNCEHDCQYCKSVCGDCDE